MRRGMTRSAVKFRSHTIVFQVDKNTMCSTGVGLLGEEDKFMSSSVLQVMKDNAKAVPGLKWQYFSSEKGVTFTYPALQFCNKNFDPRFRYA